MTFQYYLVGSASNRRHLVTRIVGGNQGFDMDYNIIIKSINKAYDDAEKTKYYKECQTILSTDAANVYIQDLPTFVAINENIGGYEFYPLYVQNFASLYIIE